MQTAAYLLLFFPRHRPRPWWLGWVAPLLGSSFHSSTSPAESLAGQSPLLWLPISLAIHPQLPDDPLGAVGISQGDLPSQRQ